MNRLILLLLLILILMPLTSSSSEPKKVNSAQHPNSESFNANTNLDERYYELLYENEINSNNRIVETMQWSISVISGFILILIGGQIFFSSKISKEEVNLIKSEISEKFILLKHEIIEDKSILEVDILKKYHPKTETL